MIIYFLLDPFLPVESNAPLLEALNLMVKWGVHRIPIVDAEGELITILSQSQVTAFMYPLV
jgi:CBS-domain-containing membrane protein